MLPWDSDFMGFRVARLHASRLAPADVAAALSLSSEQPRLVYLVAAAADTISQATARAAGARLVDQKVTFAQPLPSALLPADAWSGVSSVTETSPSLQRLAIQSGEFSRFRRDPQLPEDVFERLYAEWLTKSLRGELARTVLQVANPADGNAVGLLTLEQRSTFAAIGLLAVDASVRRTGIGHQLVAAARHHAGCWGMQELQVATQLDNQGACRFYQQNGFAVKRVEHIYHLWL